MKRKILILDDEPGLLDAYRLVFSGSDLTVPIVSSRRSAAAPMPNAPPKVLQSIEVTYVSSGEKALETIQRAVSDKAPFLGGFFDVKLGSGIDGIETIRRAKDLDPNLICVIVSAYQDRSIEEITKIFGEDFSDRWDFLTKPFTHPEIEQKARNIVSNWERRKREWDYIEQIKSQQDQLIRSERLAAVGTLARGIGHEFGNILTRILGKAELAKAHNHPPEMLEALNVISSAAERAAAIVRNLQSMVKIETKRDWADVHEPIRQSLTLIQHELKKQQITVEEKLSTALPQTLINKVEIGQVFLNLLINAMHAMENGGTLSIESSAHNQGVQIVVKDTGVGIPPEVLPRIFEPLFTTKGEKGSGIGLSVARKLIENHNGSISVSSEPGRGTTFTIWIPAKGE